MSAPKTIYVSPTFAKSSHLTEDMREEGDLEYRLESEEQDKVKKIKHEASRLISSYLNKYRTCDSDHRAYDLAADIALHFVNFIDQLDSNEGEVKCVLRDKKPYLVLKDDEPMILNGHREDRQYQRHEIALLKKTEV